MGMSQTGCCCGAPINLCSTCEVTEQICCIQLEHSAWAMNAPILYRDPTTPWEEGDACPTAAISTNICGVMATTWAEDSRRLGLIYKHSCLPSIRLSWKPEGTCDNIKLCLEMVFTIPEVGTFIGTSCIYDDPTWHERDIEFEDPVYSALNASFPDEYPLPVPTIKARVCPDGFTAFPEPDREVFITTSVQRKVGGTWTADIPIGGGTTIKICSRWHGNTVCGAFKCPQGGDGGPVTWAYNPYKDKVILYGCDGRGDISTTWVCVGPVEVDYDDGNWDTSGLPVAAYPIGADPETAVSSLRFAKSTNCDSASCSGSTTPPPDPPPPECDPGCWPECVMCPERKTLYVVVSDAPDCCLSGSYALTWVGTGGGGAPTVGYYELPATVGGPMYTCGQITFLRVSCVDASHITVQLVYLRAEGEEISNLSSPATLAVTCDGSGNLESEPIHVPGRSGGRESLCGFGSDVGGDIRIVSA